MLEEVKWSNWSEAVRYKYARAESVRSCMFGFCTGIKHISASVKIGGKYFRVKISSGNNIYMTTLMVIV